MTTSSPDAFLDAMAGAVTPVTIVAANDDGGPIGRTVSAVASVSAEPPTLLVCVHRTSPLHDVLMRTRRFSVNVLGAHDAALADAFAGRHGEHARGFDGARWARAATGPRLRDAAAWFACVLRRRTAAGTHSVLIAEVVHSRRGTATALAYTGRRYAVPAAAHGERGMAA